MSEEKSALDVQVGGDWYKKLAIQPIEYTHKNNLNFGQGNIIKYCTRYKDKNGIEDLKKVIHYAQLLAELDYGEKLKSENSFLKEKDSLKDLIKKYKNYIDNPSAWAKEFNQEASNILKYLIREIEDIFTLEEGG